MMSDFGDEGNPLEEGDGEDKVDPLDELKLYIRKRATFKRKVTLYFNDLEDLHKKGKLTPSLCKARVKEIDRELSQIRDWDNKINELIEDYDIRSFNKEEADKELDGQADYNISVGLQIDNYEDYLSEKSTSPSSISADKVMDMMSKINMSEAKPPPLDCGTFTGREKDKFAFNTFLNQFNNVIASRKNLSDATKQTYLYGYLRDYALKVVKHLPISDDNYKLALTMLKGEFLDVSYITDETFKNILKAAPSMEFDLEFTSVKIYLNEIRAYLYDLKSHKVDLLEEGTAGHKFVSHVVFNKLPASIKKEMVHKVHSNYPTITEILANYNEVIKTLVKTTTVKKKVVKPFVKPSGSGSGASNSFSKPREVKGTMQSYNAVNNKVVKLSCKLCSAEGHSLGRCPSFVNLNDRLARLRELSLCIRCAGTGHSEENC